MACIPGERKSDRCKDGGTRECIDPAAPRGSALSAAYFGYHVHPQFCERCAGDGFLLQRLEQRLSFAKFALETAATRARFQMYFDITSLQTSSVALNIECDIRFRITACHRC